MGGIVGVAFFAVKAVIGVFIQVWLRWTVPRIRIDQVISVCIKYLIPISCFLFLGAICWPWMMYLSQGQTTWTKPLGGRVAAAIEGETPGIPVGMPANDSSEGGEAEPAAEGNPDEEKEDGHTEGHSVTRNERSEVLR